MDLLGGVLQAYGALPEEEQTAVSKSVATLIGSRRFIPHPGPQTDAYFSEADVLLYGGAAGGGKSFLAVGLAAQEHQRSIIFRRESSQTDGLEATGKELIKDDARYNGQDMTWSWPDGRSLKLAGMKEPGDWVKHAGRERDFIGFDEAGEFVEEQIASIMAWNRGPTGQRCRVVLASNPPRSTDGAWMLEWFAPWLDKMHPNPAAPGELRWAVMLKGKPVWQDGPGMVEIDGESYKPLSFTFIPARLSDNPDRNTPEYRARLNSLPEPLRSQLLYGAFDVETVDDPWQVIPTAWVHAAVDRWTEKPPAIVPQCAIGADVAQGGADETVLAIRHDGWFAPLVRIPGSETPNGVDVAGRIISKRRDNSLVVVDNGGGWGADTYGHLRANDIECFGYLGVKPSVRREKKAQLRFTNVRTEAYWGLREALDPEQPGGSPIMLPNDRKLIAELCSLTYEVTPQGIKALSKEKHKEVLGRSPDSADAVIMAWYAGAKAADSLRSWENRPTSHRHRTVQINLRKPRR